MNGREPTATAQLDALLTQYIQLKEAYIALEADLAAARAEVELLTKQAKRESIAISKGDVAMKAELDAARAEVARLREAIQVTLDSPCVMGSEDIDRLVAALEER